MALALGSMLLLAHGPLQAQAAPAAAPQIDGALSDQVRGLVGSSLNLPPGPAGQPRVVIEIGRLDPRLRLAPCRRIEPQLPAQGQLWGKTRIGLHCVEGERPWKVYLPVQVQVFAPAVTAVRALAAGTELGAEHLQLTEVDWAAEPQAPALRAEDLIGRTLGRAVPAGQAVRSTDLRLRQWFAAGDTVRVVARGTGFAVSGEGQALGAGIEGRTVRVRTDAGRVLTGVPVADRRVEVQL